MKRALITGGSGAIGAAICRALAADGLHVVVHANSRLDAAQVLAEEIRAAGGSAEAVCFDVASAADTSTALDKLLQDGAIQVLVNNAGIHRDGILAGMSQEQWHSVIDVSLNGFFNVTQPLLLPMLRTRWGRIINMSSIAGVMGNRGQANYAAAKAGLIGATKSLAQEVASRGVTVNAVAPGIIESPMIQDAFPAETINSLVPMKRAGEPEEVAALVSFLASDKAAYISGQVISINGAMA
ncbi:MAG: 3-oxoacyl-ACP reductase FabG [Sulfurimicrobium sp.]|nr:3-oxoacyl-ACP reductase FabG [Sulfurimicrobium sp.]MDO9188649.1 3-oxoacyl-ACP reductase FabG [Sulfurimicrobium sp.]MDP1703628.1 3-oxoacyl-ACP reductase FabG [Sulfurimicrobium sp.]MDP2199502.1 3-oxoacyl-ACP reductase FabG [Sulfurimicrobium sp.]MDP3687186.1 3-oxoacyl-ACP reductase FabG [Sulfurimicrobium sp.]